MRSQKDGFEERAARDKSKGPQRGGEAMKRSIGRLSWLWCIVVAGLMVSIAGNGFAGPLKAGRGDPAEGVYIDLTADFYRALQQGGYGNEKLYGNDTADEYLRQIAVSAKYMVETNLQLLRQQEKMIQLLQSIGERAGKN